MDEMKEFLEQIAKRECWDDDPDDFNPYDYSGGNSDDAYFGGADDGETHLARLLLTKFFGVND